MKLMQQQTKGTEDELEDWQDLFQNNFASFLRLNKTIRGTMQINFTNSNLMPNVGMHYHAHCISSRPSMQNKVAQTLPLQQIQSNQKMQFITDTVGLDGFIELTSSAASSVFAISYDVVAFWTQKWYRRLLFPPVERGRMVQHLERAKTYAEWSQVAQRLDELDGNAALRTKNTKEDAEYDKAMIEEMIQEMRLHLRSNNLEKLCKIAEVCCARNFGETLNPTLYSFLYFGTKQEIEEFYMLLEECIARIADFGGNDVNKAEVERRKRILVHIRSRLGNSALLLSGGASLGVLHIGVTKGLLENSLLPMILHGTSAGSIIAAIIGVKNDDEIEDALKLTNLELGAFEEYDIRECSFVQRTIKRLRRFVATGAIYDSETIIKCMRHNLGDATFKEAHEKTGRILNIAVSSSSGYDMPKMLNYITAPDVVVWSAVVASCAIPKIFSSAVILAKCKVTQRLIPWHSTFHENIDGSMENDLPVRSLTEMLNVNFFIVSQVNIHIAPFLFNDLKMNWKQKIAKKSLQFVKKELLFRMQQMKNLGLYPKWLSLFNMILSQQYHGDVTIVPRFQMNDYFSLFTNPSPSFVRDCVVRGEKALWPNLALIKNAIRIEKLLDKIITSF